MPGFHPLRDIRAGKPQTRMTSRESSWSHPNHMGYLSACESHAAKAMERATGSQLTFLKNFAYAWETRNREQLLRLVNECESFFDPSKPSTLVYFVGLGGVDLFSRLICDNAEWLVSPMHHNQPSPIFFVPHSHALEGLHIYNTMLRVLTELLVCYNDIGWYMYDRHRYLVHRLIDMVSVEALRDSAIMLLEHLISVVGPVIHIPSHPNFGRILMSLNHVGVACMCRVLALLVIPGIMTDHPHSKPRIEPFPQCLVRIKKVQAVADDNVRWILSQEGLMYRLLELSNVRSSGVRIVHGNRTTTVTNTPDQVSGLQFPQGIATNAAMQAILTQLQNAVPATAAATTTGGGSAAASPVAAALDDDDEYEDDEDDDSDDDVENEHLMHLLSSSGGGGASTGSAATGGGGTFAAPAATTTSATFQFTEEMFQNPAALQAALQHMLGLVQQQTPAPVTAVPVAAAAPPPPAPAPAATQNNTNSAAAAAPTAGPAPPPTGAEGAAAAPMDALHTFAQSISQDLPPVNSLDSINFSWFCGRPCPRTRWRFHDGHGVVESSWDVDYKAFLHGVLQTPQGYRQQSEAFLRRMLTDEERRHKAATEKQKRHMESHAKAAIVNSQSEIYFVLNSVIVARHYSLAWRVLTKYNVLQYCEGSFDAVFFVGQRPHSIHVSPPSNRSATTAAPGNQRSAGRFEVSDVVAGRSSKFYETFWHPTHYTCTTPPPPPSNVAGAAGGGGGGVATAASSQPQAASPLTDSAGGSPTTTTTTHFDNDGESDDLEESPDHRHDPDTLRKLEFLRTVHEYCNAQDRTEHNNLVVVASDDALLGLGSTSEVTIKVKDSFATSATTGGEVDPLAGQQQKTTRSDSMRILSEKMAVQITRGLEDPCTETVGAHAIEGMLRCLTFGHSSEERSQPSSIQNIVGHILLPHILEERVYNATHGNGGSVHGLVPGKRIDAFFAVVGEACKYNPTMLDMFHQYMDGSIPVPQQPKYFGAPHTHPNQVVTSSASSAMATSTPALSLEEILQAAPLARGENESFLSVMNYRIRRFGVETNLFLRCLCMSVTPQLRCRVNYTTKPSDVLATPDAPPTSSSSHDMEEAIVRLSTLLVDSQHGRALGDRHVEPNTVQMQRLYYIRKHSRAFVESLCSSSSSTVHHASHRMGSSSTFYRSMGPDETYQWSVATLKTIMNAPCGAPAGGQPFPDLFAESELSILRPGAKLPRAGLSSALRLLHGYAGHPEEDASCVYIADHIFGKPHELVYGMQSAMNAELMENTEKLCVVTTTLLLFLRISAVSGQRGIDDALRNLASLAEDRRERSSAPRRRAAATAHGSNVHTHHHHACRTSGTCSANTPLDLQCDAFVLYGHCSPFTNVGAYYDAHGTDFFKNFFRLLCLWLCHYGCSQRYVETLFFCTEIPFGEWKVVALYLFRELPKYFA